MMRQLTAALLVLHCLAYAAAGHALECYKIDNDEAFKAATQVVIGRFNSVEAVGDSGTKYKITFEVLDVLKGPLSETITLTLDKERYLDPDAYIAGVKYLMFLEAGQTEIRICEKISMLEGPNAQWYAAWQDKERGLEE
jgi:hypothetical protein